MTATPRVAECRDLAPTALPALVARYGVRYIEVEVGAAIPFSYWGEPEAGIHGAELYVRADTPVHSALHELGHVVCMPAARRRRRAANAGSDVEEECAVCYLQVLLADTLPHFGRARCFADMDAWGYSFREGSAQSWFHGDGTSARAWLVAHALIESSGEPTWRLRGAAARGGRAAGALTIVSSDSVRRRRRARGRTPCRSR